MREYDYLIVGAGLSGATFAYLAHKHGRKVLVIDKRSHIGGNCYTENKFGINIHKYGAHIFHTNEAYVWNFINKFGEFNNFINSPIAIYKDEVYSMPFNMYTFNKMWGVKDPFDAKLIINSQTKSIKDPKNLEEQAISLVGRDIYKKLVKGYTEKQWGRKCKDLPPEIIKRLPVRFTYDNNYFNARYQGIPISGYTEIIKNMLYGIEVMLNTSYNDIKKDIHKGTIKVNKIIYTGSIDEIFNCPDGHLQYRTLRFEHLAFPTDNKQGNAVINYTDINPPYTRSIEHKWFNFGCDSLGNKIDDITIVSYEYPKEWESGDEPYYPINDEHNDKIYNDYTIRIREYNKKNTCKFIPLGRLGEYKYYDMDQAIDNAIRVYCEQEDINFDDLICENVGWC